MVTEGYHGDSLVVSVCQIFPGHEWKKVYIRLFNRDTFAGRRIVVIPMNMTKPEPAGRYTLFCWKPDSRRIKRPLNCNDFDRMAMAKVHFR